MSLDFEKFAQEGIAFVRELAEELGYPEDTSKAGRVLKAVLHTVRDHMPVQESVQLLAQLPPALKAVYTDSWSLKKGKRHIHHADDFLREIREGLGPPSQKDLPDNDAAALALGVVFRVLRKYISLGEFEDIKAVLPKEVKALIMPGLMI